MTVHDTDKGVLNHLQCIFWIAKKQLFVNAFVQNEVVPTYFICI